MPVYNDCNHHSFKILKAATAQCGMCLYEELEETKRELVNTRIERVKADQRSEQQERELEALRRERAYLRRRCTEEKERAERAEREKDRAWRLHTEEESRRYKAETERDNYIAQANHYQELWEAACAEIQESRKERDEKG